MQIVKWVLILTFWTVVAAFFHYTLPQQDIVRITDTENRRIDFGENSIFWASPDVGNDATRRDRDVFFIQAVRENGKPMVYRNEDTGWGWPPYFKFDTSNLQTEAADLKSTSENPKWVLMSHYGWRVVYLSSFPNAINLTPIDGPDAGKPIPWVNIVILTVFLALVYAIWVRWRRFRMARIDPVLEEIEDNWEAAGDAIDQKRGRFRRWLATWRAK